MSPDKVRRAVCADWPDQHPDSAFVRSGFMLLSALIVGTGVRALGEFTGLPAHIIGNGSWYARRSRLWVRRGSTWHMFYDWEDTPISFMLDCMVVTGHLWRHTSFDLDTQPHQYSLRTWGTNRPEDAPSDRTYTVELDRKDKRRIELQTLRAAA